eukprot:794974-Rhodomonas_salina.2
MAARAQYMAEETQRHRDTDTQRHSHTAATQQPHSSHTETQRQTNNDTDTQTHRRKDRHRYLRSLMLFAIPPSRMLASLRCSTEIAYAAVKQPVLR